MLVNTKSSSIWTLRNRRADVPVNEDVYRVGPTYTNSNVHRIRLSFWTFKCILVTRTYDRAFFEAV